MDFSGAARVRVAIPESNRARASIHSIGRGENVKIPSPNALRPASVCMSCHDGTPRGGGIRSGSSQGEVRVRSAPA